MQMRGLWSGSRGAHLGTRPPQAMSPRRAAKRGTDTVALTPAKGKGQHLPVLVVDTISTTATRAGVVSKVFTVFPPGTGRAGGSQHRRGAPRPHLRSVSGRRAALRTLPEEMRPRPVRVSAEAHTFHAVSQKARWRCCPQQRSLLDQ